jgi:hypothetical protein
MLRLALNAGVCRNDTFLPVALVAKSPAHHRILFVVTQTKILEIHPKMMSKNEQHSFNWRIVGC